MAARDRGGTKLPLADELGDGARTRDGDRAAGAASLYVSHAHGAPFRGLLDALEAYLDDEGYDASTTFFWIDVFSLPPAPQSPSVALPTVAACVGTIGTVVVVLDGAATALSRLWCLFEISRSLAEPNLCLHFTMARAHRARFVEALDADGGAALLGGLDVARAAAHADRDRAAILGALAASPDAERATNARLRARVESALIQFDWSKFDRRRKDDAFAKPEPVPPAAKGGGGFFPRMSGRASSRVDPGLAR